MRRKREREKKEEKAELSNLRTKYTVAYSQRIYNEATLIGASQQQKNNSLTL